MEYEDLPKPPFTETKPSCGIPTESCRSMLSAYSSYSTLQESAFYGLTTLTPPYPDPVEWPYCAGRSTSCFLRATGKARLFYWPVPTTVSRDMCIGSDPDVVINTREWQYFASRAGLLQRKGMLQSPRRNRSHTNKIWQVIPRLELAHPSFLVVTPFTRGIYIFPFLILKPEQVIQLWAPRQPEVIAM